MDVWAGVLRFWRANVRPRERPVGAATNSIRSRRLRGDCAAAFPCPFVSPWQHGEHNRERDVINTSHGTMDEEKVEWKEQKIKQAHTGAFFQPAGTGEKRCHHKGQCHKILFIQMTAFSEQEVWAVCDATLVGGRRSPSHGLCWVGKFHRPTDCTLVSHSWDSEGACF